MNPEQFIFEMYETMECQSTMYTRMAITKNIGLYYSMKRSIGQIDSFMVPFRDKVKTELIRQKIDFDSLLTYMIDNDEYNCVYYAAATRFSPKAGLSDLDLLANVPRTKTITPYVDHVDLDIYSLIVISFIYDNFRPSTLDIAQVVKEEIFGYPTNSYNLTKVNGAIFKRDGLIFGGKGYLYSYFVPKVFIDQYDPMPGFAQIIYENTQDCDIFFRLDERLAMPADEYENYTGVGYARYYGPSFKFDGSTLSDYKTVIVHIDDTTGAKLLMVIKKDYDQTVRKPFWHIEIEALPNPTKKSGFITTTFLHGKYYPERKIFSHIDYAKNRYEAEVYYEKFCDSTDGAPIDTYTDRKELHYKIWCIENGEFTIETWYRLMIISLPPKYQPLLNEILEC